MCGNKIGHFLIPALTGTLAAENRPRAFSLAAAQSTCSQCGAPVSSAFTWCPRCGQPLRARVEPKASVCAYCGRAINAEAQLCPSCGAPIGKK